MGSKNAGLMAELRGGLKMVGYQYLGSSTKDEWRDVAVFKGKIGIETQWMDIETLGNIRVIPVRNMNA